MVIGGYPYTSDVKIVDMTSETSTCPKPSDYPLEIYGMVGTFRHNRPLVCGGRFRFANGTTSRTQECHEYTFETDSWDNTPFSTVEERRHSSEVFFESDGSWLILGGEWEVSTTSEILPDNGDFSPANNIQASVWVSCLVKINDSHIFVTGGWTDPGNSVKTNIFNKISGLWTEMDDMRIARREHACGLVTDGTETEIVVAGGLGYNSDGSSYNELLTSVEIFSLSEESWRHGTDLPLSIHGMVSFQMQRSFLVVGGLSSGVGNLNLVHEFDRLTYQWVLRNQTLGTARRFFPAIALPNDMDICT